MTSDNIKRISIAALIGFPVFGAISFAQAAAPKFEDNSLVKGSAGKIFVVKSGMLKPIHSLAELQQEHFGQKISRISDDALKAMPVLGEDNPAMQFNDKSLIRDKQDGKIFLLTAGERMQVKNLSQLADLRREHAALGPVMAVEHEIVTQIPRVIEDNPERKLDDNSLVKSSDGKIFVIKHGEAIQIKDLAELQQEHLGQHINMVEDNSLRLASSSGEDNPARLNDSNSSHSSSTDNSVRSMDDNLPQHSGVDNAAGGSGEVGSGGGSNSGGSGSGGSNSGGSSSGGSHGGGETW